MNYLSDPEGAIHNIGCLPLRSPPGAFLKINVPWSIILEIKDKVNILSFWVLSNIIHLFVSFQTDILNQCETIVFQNYSTRVLSDYAHRQQNQDTRPYCYLDRSVEVTRSYPRMCISSRSLRTNSLARVELSFPLFQCDKNFLLIMWQYLRTIN